MGTALKIAKATAAATPAKVAEIAVLAKRQMEMEDGIARLVAELEVRNKALYKMKTETLPLAIRAAQVKAITLPNGDEVIVEDFVTGNIKEENRAKAFAWLRKSGFGSLIKHTVKMAFGMGEDKKAMMIEKLLVSKRVPFEAGESVHPSTLRSFVRERLEAGKALPPVIDVTSVPTATIKRSK